VRVSIIVPTLPDETIWRHAIVQARLFRERGDEVHLLMPSKPGNLPDDLAALAADTAAPLPPSDLYLYHQTEDHPLLASLRQLGQGTVVVHDHGTAPKDWLPAYYADLCLVDDSTRRDELLHGYGLAPERVHIVPALDREQEYGIAIIEWVKRALADDWPPVPQVEERGAGFQQATQLTTSQAALQATSQLAQSQADIMLRDYAVRSRIPLVGGLVAWLRRNLTSHLREPYLDPTLERQVAFNRTVLDWMVQTQTRLETLETQVRNLQGQLSTPSEEGMQGAPGHQSSHEEQTSDAG
jgi:hypothetical protein